MTGILPGITLTEYQTETLDGVSLSKEDMKLAESLGGGEGKLVVDDMKRGVRVSASSWVGVVRFHNFEVRVVPKLAGENLGLVGMLAFTTGLDALKRNKGLRNLATLPQED